MIICICRGKSDRDVKRAMEAGARSLAELQQCGIGDQCGSCHHALRSLLAAAVAADERPCPACIAPAPASASATA